MFDSIHRHIMAGYAVSIEFTKQGWRQFARLNASLGTRYIRAFILKREVAEYLAAHEAASVKLDTECQEVRYDGGVHPLIKSAVGQAYILVVRPFPEGNERLARMISSAVLLRSGYDLFRDISISGVIARED